jgi:hypothetical protein
MSWLATRIHKLQILKQDGHELRAEKALFFLDLLLDRACLLNQI